MDLIDLTGQRFGRWTVKSYDPTSTKPRYWFCVCDCGTKKRVTMGSLRNGRSQSCGCYASDWTKAKHTTHGMHRHSAYNSWRKFKDRCQLPTATGYVDYGGRGIKFCEQWHDFAAFWKDMGPTWVEGLSLDRIDVNGDYEPRNCRWATPMQQGNNRRNNQVIPTPYGPMTVSDAARQFKVNRNTIFRRIRDGWPRERLIEPAQFHPRWHNEQETP